MLCAFLLLAADELLEALAQKGVIIMEEYERLKASRKNAATTNTDDGFRVLSGDGNASVQVGALQQLDFAAYQDEPRYDLPDGTEFRRSRISVGRTFLKGAPQGAPLFCSRRYGGMPQAFYDEGAT